MSGLCAWISPTLAPWNEEGDVDVGIGARD